MTKDNETLFQRAMKKVRPIKKKKLVMDKPSRPIRKLSPQHKAHQSKDMDAYAHLEISCAPQETLLHTDKSLSPRIVKKLKKGLFPIQARSDLHGLTLAEADQQLTLFLERCQNEGLRSVIVIHGKGSGKLKSAVHQWLQEHPAVLAFSSAIPKEGGTGALYVLLRKGTR